MAWEQALGLSENDMALPNPIGRQKAECSLPPHFLSLPCIYSPGFQLCSHSSLGEELSAIATNPKGPCECFAPLAQQRLRPFKAKEGTILCLCRIKGCVERCPRVLRFPSPACLCPFQPVPTAPVSPSLPRCMATLCSNTTSVAPLGQRATLLSEVPVLNTVLNIWRVSVRRQSWRGAEFPVHVLLGPIVKIYFSETNHYKSFETQTVPCLGTHCVLEVYL